MTFCSEFLLKSSEENGDAVLPLACRCWSCDYCAPRRRAALMMLAASGEPNKILTLTIRPDGKSTATEQYKILHRAWKLLVKRSIRELTKVPNDRWKLKQKARSNKTEKILRSLTAKDERRDKPRIHYMAFNEETKRGTPHLHILLRCAYIPQDWIAEQMQDLAGSPVCWVEAIKTTRQAIKYVTKYVTKQPAQFGTSKRYWVSRWWTVNNTENDNVDERKRPNATLERVRFADWLQGRFIDGWTWRVEDDGWWRFWRPGYHPGRRGDIDLAAGSGQDENE